MKRDDEMTRTIGS